MAATPLHADREPMIQTPKLQKSGREPVTMFRELKSEHARENHRYEYTYYRERRPLDRPARAVTGARTSLAGMNYRFMTDGDSINHYSRASAASARRSRRRRHRSEAPNFSGTRRLRRLDPWVAVRGFRNGADLSIRRGPGQEAIALLQRGRS